MIFCGPEQKQNTNALEYQQHFSTTNKQTVTILQVTTKNGMFLFIQKLNLTFDIKNFLYIWHKKLGDINILFKNISIRVVVH